MNKSPGIWGYILLIISSAFIDVPIIALLAMLAFLAGVVILLIFFYNLIDKDKPHRWLFISLVTLGTLMLAAALGYSAVEFTEYLVSKHRGEEIANSHWSLIIQIKAINIVSSLIIFIGIKHSSKLNKKALIFSWLPTLLIIPVTIILVKLLEIIGMPLSA